ncbi:AP-1 complex-associated regulatory protein-like isoform X1 [Lineus longissimus]|uniref:AP-1 complex-associated regulatory protein-like isoform X1 n=1 Tax=Lineus longissimus TaxID=88925 RepID=UPI002B4DAE16
MGNCLGRCFGKFDKRKYLRTRYNVERDFSIEFENLMDDETQPEESVIPISDRERDLLSTHKFDDLLHEQKRIDVQIDRQLAKQEEELRLEEEAYYEAKREAARVARLRKAQQNATKAGTQGAIANGPKGSWLGEDEAEWDVAGGEDDFEMFLESVKARSLTARIQQQVQFGVADTQSTTSSNQTKERSHTEASSIDLEWEHEAGFIPEEGKQERSNTEENLASIATKGHELAESPSSNDLEWDNNFVSAETLETEKLLPSFSKKLELIDR